MDERRFYLPWLGIFASLDPREMDFARAAGTPTDPEIVWTVGMRGYFAPRTRAVIDWFALADPFLARIRPFPGGRPGHAFRPLPDSFWRWRDPAHGFGEARLDALARDLRLAHRSPELFSWERLRAIGRLLRERRVPVDAIDVRAAGGEVEIAIRAARIDARIPRAGKPVIWINRDCVPSAPRLADGFLVDVDDDGRARVRCPGQGFSTTPLRVSAGTFDPPGSATPGFSSQGAWIVRDRFAWLGSVPRWATSGHE
jgi:hypothetical protein